MKQSFRHILLRNRSLLILAGLLFLLSFLFSTYFSSKSTISKDRKQLENYLHHQQQDFNAFLKDTVLLRKLVKKNESLEEFKQIAKRNYGIYIFSTSFFDNYNMLFWSNQVIVPDENSYNLADGEYFQHLVNGYYLTEKKSISLPGIANAIQVYALMPVRFDYFIETDYMHQEFAFSEDADDRILIKQEPTAHPVKALSGKVLFYLDKKIGTAVHVNDNITMALRISALILLLMFFHFFAETIAKTKGVWQGVILLAGLLLSLRLIIYFFPVILNFRQFELFDPTIYGTDEMQRSLGDLLINSLLFCWIVLFAWSKLGHATPGIITKPPWKWVTGIGGLFLLILSTFSVGGVIRTLIADSKISFDVTNFFSLTKYSVVGFVVLASLSLGYYYFTQLLFRYIFPVFEKKAFLIYFAMALTGLIYLTFRSGDPLIRFYLPVLLWLIIYTWLVSHQKFVINRFRINIAGILFWIFVFSVSISAIILSENKVKEWQTRTAMAEKIALENDPSNEKQISIALTYLDNDFLLRNFFRFKNAESNRVLKDSIINYSYRGYINKYDTRLYIFDRANKPLYNNDPTSYEALSNILSVQARTTNIQDLYYYETSFDKFTYITRREVIDANNKKLGSFFIISTPKKYSSDALSP
ncbi:MAG: hypothetical protein M3O67_06855, partial [Bacteroidota bacterium]|nr:hypothetical protein [Bacteroidota bacterium]